jgi:hypothetical protein
MALSRGRPELSARDLNAFQRDLNALQRNDRISSASYATLSANYDQLVTQLGEPVIPTVTPGPLKDQRQDRVPARDDRSTGTPSPTPPAATSTPTPTATGALRPGGQRQLPGVEQPPAAPSPKPTVPGRRTGGDRPPPSADGPHGRSVGHGRPDNRR